MADIPVRYNLKYIGAGVLGVATIALVVWNRIKIINDQRAAENLK